MNEWLSSVSRLIIHSGAPLTKLYTVTAAAVWSVATRPSASFCNKTAMDSLPGPLQSLCQKSMRNSAKKKWNRPETSCAIGKCACCHLLPLNHRVQIRGLTRLSNNPTDLCTVAARNKTRPTSRAPCNSILGQLVKKCPPYYETRRSIISPLLLCVMSQMNPVHRLPNIVSLLRGLLDHHAVCLCPPPSGLYYPLDTRGTVPTAYDIFRAYEGMEGRKSKNETW
jgi:hypothetical protein